MKPSADAARVLSRVESVVSPWVRLVSKQVRFTPDGPVATYHCLAVSDYMAVLAETKAGLIPIVRQFRPAVDAYTWELPAGLMEAGETPELTCRRELEEEVGVRAERCTSLGVSLPDTGRLENRLHAFHATISDPRPDFVPEPGLEVRFVDRQTLKELVRNGDFNHQLHLGVLLSAMVAGVALWE